MRLIINNRKFRILKIVLLAALVGMLTMTVISCTGTIGAIRGSGDIETEERDSSLNRVMRNHL